MNMSLGQRIRTLREAKDLSLRELAKRVDKSAAFLSDIELGRRFPSDEVLALLAQELDVTQDDLRSYDTRPAVEEIRRLAAENPKYGFAFRTLVEKRLSPEELLELVETKSEKKKP
jgi:transcriptional regulator with XRE-family HTH domain